MIREVELNVLPQEVHDEDGIRQRACRKARIDPSRLRDLRYLRRSIDARGRRLFFVLRLALYIDEDYVAESPITSRWTSVSRRKTVMIIGAGPAGYFAALELIELGFKPIVLERGKDVRSRRRDLRAIQQFGEVNPHSNYCFGEGGAGTYSDGKLYTRSVKRGMHRKVLQLLVEHGAKPDILIDAHPHIGSNKLPTIIAQIRATIERYGGEIRFDTHVVDLQIANGRVAGVVDRDGHVHHGEAYILATGHSARDVYEMLHRKGLRLEAKPFALGVRIEHAQRLIDHIQYGLADRGDVLPAAAYKLTCQVDGKGVFSFCMCPGGLIVPAATEAGEIVVNGMSLSRRDSAFANSGMVTAIDDSDFSQAVHSDIFRMLHFQREVERRMFDAGDGSQAAPAQRLVDFVQGQLSPDLNASSYIPGLFSAPLHDLLPDFIYKRLRGALLDFKHKIPPYFTNEANVVGVESRTSAPIRIPRDPKTFMHADATALFPCGEGAGYAGGILSAAMDGQNVARRIAEWVA